MSREGSHPSKLKTVWWIKVRNAAGLVGWTLVDEKLNSDVGWQLSERRDVKAIVTDHIVPHPLNRHVSGILVILVCLAAGILVIPVQQSYRGRLEAYWDISHGAYKGQRCGYACIALKPTGEYDRLLFQYAKLRIETTEDCGFRMSGYNEVQETRVNRQYPGAYERALNEAIEWERRRLRNANE